MNKCLFAFCFFSGTSALVVVPPDNKLFPGGGRADRIESSNSTQVQLFKGTEESTAGHAANDECNVQLGNIWPTVPKTDVGRRFALPYGSSLIVEVGGNVGEDLAEFARRFPAASIHTYEPIPQLYIPLQNKFQHNPQVTVHGFGASDADGSAVFTMSTGNRPGHEGESSSGVNTSVVGHKVTVQLRDISAILSELRTATGRVPDVVSINCEGCEYAVLQRMAQTGWLNQIPFVQLSWHLVNGVQNRLQIRCDNEGQLRQQHHPVWWSDYGWQAWQH